MGRTTRGAIGISLGVAIILAAAAPTQEQVPVERRIVRVTLKNGAILEGNSVRQGSDGIVLLMTSGEISLKRDAVERIEEVKVRATREEPLPRPPSPQPRLQEPPASPSADVRERMEGILSAYRHASEIRRHELSRELARIAPLGIPYLVRRFEMLDGPAQALVAGILVECRSTLSAAAMEPLLRSSKATVRAEAAGILSVLTDPQAAAALALLLNDAIPGVRTAAVRGLAAVGTREAFRQIAAAAVDPDRQVRLAALQSLPLLAEKNDCREALDSALLDAFDRTRGGARADVASVMGISKREGLCRYLVDALRDDSPQVRAAVVRALVNLGARPWQEWIVDRFVREEEPIVRVALADAAMSLKLHGTVDTLISWLDAGDRSVAFAAHRALRSLTERDFGPTAAPWRRWWDAVKPN